MNKQGKDMLPPGSAPIYTHSLEYMEKYKKTMNKQDNVPQVKTVEERATEIIRRIPVHPANFDYISKRQYGINGSLAQDIKYAMKEYAQPLVDRIAELEGLLKAKDEELMREYKKYSGHANYLKSKIAELEASNTKYREALEGILKVEIGYEGIGIDEITSLAEQALKQEVKGG